MLITLDKKQEKILYALTFVAIGLGFVFLRSYLLLIIFSAIMSVLFSPIYSYFIRKGRSKGTASFYTFVASLLIVVIPMIFVIVITGLQINSLISIIDTKEFSVNFSDILNQIIETVNKFLESVNVNTRISIESVTANASGILSSISASLVSNIASAFSSFFGLITSAIIYIYVFLSRQNQRSTKKVESSWRRSIYFIHRQSRCNDKSYCSWSIHNCFYARF